VGRIVRIRELHVRCIRGSVVVDAEYELDALGCRAFGHTTVEGEIGATSPFLVAAIAGATRTELITATATAMLPSLAALKTRLRFIVFSFLDRFGVSSCSSEIRGRNLSQILQINSHENIRASTVCRRLVRARITSPNSELQEQGSEVTPKARNGDSPDVSKVATHHDCRVSCSPQADLPEPMRLGGVMTTRTMRYSSVVALFAAVVLSLIVLPSSSASDDPTTPSFIYDPHHLLVSFQDEISDTQRVAMHDSLGASRVTSLPNLGIDVVALPHAVAPHDARFTYLSIRGVRNAELNTYGSPLAVSKPNDPEFVNQWYLHNEGQNVSGGILGGSPDLVNPEPDFDMDVPEAWHFAAKRPGSARPVRFAILDSGIDATHPDLQGSVVACATAISSRGLVTERYCNDDHGHGTHLAGTVAARRGNEIGVAGIAPEAGLAVFKLMDTNGRISRADFLAGIEWAMDPHRGDADILSMSFAMPECAPVDMDKEALDKAHEAGLLLVAAAGNKTCPLTYRAEKVINPNAEGDDPVYPSAYEDVLSVTGTTGHGRFWSRATCNITVDMAAPAETIWSTVAGFLGGGYTPANGTSLAATQVAAAAALLMGEWDLSRDQLLERLLVSVTAIKPDSARPSACSDVGQLNLRDALTGSRAR
jgi:hypothetical protein